MTQYSLSEFNAIVKATLEEQLDPSYWIVAEIGELNVNRNGHCYLDLVEKEGNQIRSKMRGTIWSYTYVKLSNAFESQAGTTLKSGMKVLLNATLDFHEIYGLSLNVRDIDPSFTLGEREKQRQQTIQQLTDDGTIGLNKGMTIPTIPQKIAIISSETAAGYGDFINQLHSNPYGYVIDTRLYNATMQGDAAPISIIDCLHRIHEIEESFDAVIVIRGGGAKTDLDCFDDYELCSHLAQFPLPVITGIGHERDSTIADLVACVNLKTPTAVAEFLLSAFLHFESEVNLLMDQISGHGKQLIAKDSENLILTDSTIRSLALRRIENETFKLDNFENAFSQRPLEKLRNEKGKLDMLDRIIQVQDPKNVLKKGFTMTKINGRYLTGKIKVQKGDEIETISTNQTIKSKAE